MGKKPFTLYWSRFERYERCPQQYLWHYGWPGIDVGAGPGKRKPKPEKQSEHHILMGEAIGWVVERFYNDELWRHLDPKDLPKRLLQLLEKDFDRRWDKSHIDFQEAARSLRTAPAQVREEMHKVCTEGVWGFLKTLRHHRLLGEYAKSEVDLGPVYLNKRISIGGRADIVIRKGDEISILDGKNSKKYAKKRSVNKTPVVERFTYTNPDQLRWYALCFWLGYRVMPTKLGFLYYRYPAGWLPDPEDLLEGERMPEEPSTGIEWVSFSKEDLKGLASRALDVRKLMDKGVFDANPEPSHCRLCDYESVCPQRQEQRTKNAAKRGPKKDIFKGQTGFVTLDDMKVSKK